MNGYAYDFAQSLSDTVVCLTQVMSGILGLDAVHNERTVFKHMQTRATADGPELSRCLSCRKGKGRKFTKQTKFSEITAREYYVDKITY